jgi:hypothetical protein
MPVTALLEQPASRFTNTVLDALEKTLSQTVFLYRLEIDLGRGSLDVR